MSSIHRNNASARSGTSNRQEHSKKLARSGRLRYVADTSPGLHRHKRGRGFTCIDAAGKSVCDRHTLRRIQELAIPPAWTDVWICPYENGHLQATGFDDRGRKQYLYHARWRELADQSKFDRLIDVGQALRRIRRRVAADLRQRTLSERLVVAAMVRLLDATGIRIGSAEYRRDNGSYGLTTLARRHASVHGKVVRLEFHGKGGVRHRLEVSDPTVARVVRRCLKLSSKHLFQYQSADGIRPVSAEDVNQYLNAASGEAITAKDFRTWQASVCVAAELAAIPDGASHRQSTCACKGALTKAAKLLGNTVMVCRKYYVHSGIVDAYCSGDYSRLVADFAPRRTKWFARNEQLLLHVLRNVTSYAPGSSKGHTSAGDDSRHQLSS